MSFSSDLWNGFDLLKNTFLNTFNKMKNFYEIMFSFASLEKNYTINLEMLYEQYKVLFNSDEIFLLPSKNFISNIKVECEYHKLFYNNIFENILSPMRKIIESKKKIIINNFCDNKKNSERYEKLVHNLISYQERYHNSCNELAKCLSEINIYTLNLEQKKKQGISRSLSTKRDKCLEKVYRTQIDYLNILTESNIILKDYNIKTENLLNNLEKEFIDIGECIKKCLNNYSENKIQLFHDVLEILNQSKNSCYGKMDVKKDIENFVKKNATKEFKFEKFEYIPFKISKINKENLFSDFKENSKNNPINQDKVIEMVKKYFIDNKITETDSEYILRTVNSLKKHSIEFNIKYDSFLEEDKNKENNNLISEFIPSDENQNYINTSNNTKKNEIFKNINYIENFMNKLLLGEEKLENEIIKLKTFLQKKENIIYSEEILDSINNFRKKGNYILSDKTYEYFIDIFKFLLETFKNNENILTNIITYSQTFYKIKEGNTNPKYFILYSIRDNLIFSQESTWHKIINNSLSNGIKNKDFIQTLEKDEKDKKINEYAFKIIVENLSVMKLFTINNEIYDEVKNYYVNVYKIDEETLNKEINIFYNENEFNIFKDNENQLIKGENKEILIKNDLNEKNIIEEEKNEIIENNKKEVLENK